MDMCMYNVSTNHLWTRLFVGTSVFPSEKNAQISDASFL